MKKIQDNNINVKHYPVINHADSLEDILCLSSLIASGKLNPNSTFQDSNKYYESLEYGCSNCSLNDVCLACIINQ
jgi:hypothetical protein